MRYPAPLHRDPVRVTGERDAWLRIWANAVPAHALSKEWLVRARASQTSGARPRPCAQELARRAAAAAAR